jgi:hypothetical protein
LKMPIIADPTPSWLKSENASVMDSPLIRGLRAAGHLIGADDPNQVMGVGGTGIAVSPEAEGVLGWLGSKLFGKAAPTPVGAAQSAFKPSVTQLGKLAVPSITRTIPTAAETLGEISPDFTAVGGEGIYNAARSGLRSTIPDPSEAAHARFLSQGGRSAPPGANSGTALLDAIRNLKQGGR